MRISSKQLNAAVAASQAQDLGHAIDRWRNSQGLTQAQLRQTAKVSQGQLSRILAGRFRRASPAVHRLCRAAGIDLSQRLSDEIREDWGANLERALHRSWDGTPQHARELMQLLRVARALRSR